MIILLIEVAPGSDHVFDEFLCPQKPLLVERSTGRAKMRTR